MGLKEPERSRGEQPTDRLARTKQIVDLVFKLPLRNPEDQDVLLDAVGTVYEDLRTLDEQQRIERQIATGLTPQDVEDAIKDVKKAALARITDGTLTPEELDIHRGIVLSGLERIHQATTFNESVGSTTNGIAIVQAGINSGAVADTIEHVQEAADVSRKMLTEPLGDLLDVSPTPITEEPEQDIVDVGDPDPIVIDDRDLLDRAENQPNIDQKPFSPRKYTRRDILAYAGMGVGMMVAATSIAFGVGLTTQTPKPPPTPTPSPEEEAEKKAQIDEEYIRKKSLVENPGDQLSGWYPYYSVLGEDEMFVDIFDGEFRQLLDGNSFIPIYTKQGENGIVIDPVQTRIEPGIYHSSVGPALSKITIGDNEWVVSGRIKPESPEQRRYPNVVTFSHGTTKRTFHVEITPVNLGTNWAGRTIWKYQILYMKKVKK